MPTSRKEGGTRGRAEEVLGTHVGSRVIRNQQWPPLPQAGVGGHPTAGAPGCCRHALQGGSPVCWEYCPLGPSGVAEEPGSWEALWGAGLVSNWDPYAWLLARGGVRQKALPFACAGGLLRKHLAFTTGSSYMLVGCRGLPGVSPLPASNASRTASHRHTASTPPSEARLTGASRGPRLPADSTWTLCPPRAKHSQPLQ